MVWRDLEVVAFDLAGHVIVVLEGENRSTMVQEPLLRGRWFHHAAPRRDIAFQHRSRMLAGDWIADGANDIAQINLGAGNAFAESLAQNCEARKIEKIFYLRHQGTQSAGVEEVFHQQLARGANIGDDRHLARNLVKSLQIELDASAT